jgi:hypothetical protein
MMSTTPKVNTQYSLGDVKGGQFNLLCGTLLVSNKNKGGQISCKKETISCRLLSVPSKYHNSADMTPPGKGLETCEACSTATLSCVAPNHCNTSPGEEIFMRTLAFFCALIEKGCAFNIETDSKHFIQDDRHDWESEISSGSEADSEEQEVTDCWRKTSSLKKCKGKLVMCFGKYRQHFIQYVSFISISTQCSPIHYFYMSTAHQQR